MDVIWQLWNEFIYENVLILEDSIVLEMSACVLSVPREPRGVPQPTNHPPVSNLCREGATLEEWAGGPGSLCFLGNHQDCACGHANRLEPEHLISGEPGIPALYPGPDYDPLASPPTGC